MSVRPREVVDRPRHRHHQLQGAGPRPARPASSPWSRPGRRGPPWRRAGPRRRAAALLELAVGLLRRAIGRGRAAPRTGASARCRCRRAGRERCPARRRRTAVCAGDRVVRPARHRAGRPAGRAYPDVGLQFARRTGLPWDCQASIAKLLWLRDNGFAITAGHRWASVPEWVVHQLGGDLVREPSLASRTGLVDQGTGAVWADGVCGRGPADDPAAARPGRRHGGRHPRGIRACRTRAQGAALTRRRPRPSRSRRSASGAVGPDELFNSTGTADVVARSLPGVLDDDQREVLVRSGLSAGAHVLPDTTLLLGGVRGGLLLRRVLGVARRRPARRSATGSTVPRSPWTCCPLDSRSPAPARPATTW